MKEKSNEEIVPQNSNLKRIDRHYISHEIEHLLHFDRGFFFTIRELFLRPGKTVRAFLFEDRTKLVKPILFLIFSSIIFTIIIHLLHVDVNLFNIDKVRPLQDKVRSKEIGEWTSNYLGYSQLLMGVFVAIWLKIFFKKQHYNIYEIVILLSYIFGEALIIMLSGIILAELLGSKIVGSVGIGAYFLYIIWGIGQFFGEKKSINYIKSALTYILGVGTYLATLIFIAYILKLLFS